MKDAERVPGLLADLEDNLVIAADLVRRGRDAYDADAAVRLAFEALSTRIGDLCKRLVTVDPDRFDDPIWSQAAKNRDFVVHHYHRVDYAALWVTVSAGFPELHHLVIEQRSS